VAGPWLLEEIDEAVRPPPMVRLKKIALTNVEDDLAKYLHLADPRFLQRIEAPARAWKRAKVCGWRMSSPED